MKIRDLPFLESGAVPIAALSVFQNNNRFGEDTPISR